MGIGLTRIIRPRICRAYGTFACRLTFPRLKPGAGRMPPLRGWKSISDIDGTNVRELRISRHWARSMSRNCRFPDIGRDHCPEIADFQTLDRINVRKLPIFRHWAGPMSRNCGFPDIGPDQCLEFPIMPGLIRFSSRKDRGI